MASVPASGRKNKSPSTAVTARRDAIWHSCGSDKIAGEPSENGDIKSWIAQ